MGIQKKEADIYDRIGNDLKHTIQNTPVYDIVEIMPFSEKQIEEYLRNHEKRLHELGIDDLDKFRKSIIEIYNLEE